ncbi:undecaprenyl-diphosphatase [Caloramator fervidus]|uniref:Undecaprenyl-diphosphatase n=1 Tax=Caloramator fervidus TaxID=29344 RepID=A0A1H5RJR8_9CLOT|nr:undecaprenyl-diphosphate phosphatase [Caloramator fervidus]SEF38605.1 undecaprenyl-diphosphatase [Caloramator fervidus]
MILKAIILGIIEGLTEFLPISSTGHLIIANKYINFTGEFANVFDVVIQVGAILAVIFYFWDKIFPSFNNKQKAKKVYYLWVKVVLGFLPAAVLGFLFEDKIDKYLFNPLSVSIALIFGAILLLIAESKLKRVRVFDTDDMTYMDALLVGIFQCLALWPGMSRSASTIIGGLLIGLSREVSAEFSFFLAIPTLIGASFLKLLKSSLSFSLVEWTTLFIGTLVSFIVALLVIKFFMGYIKRKDLRPFAYYRILLAVIVILFEIL